MNKQRDSEYDQQLDRFVNALMGMAAASYFFSHMGMSPRSGYEFFTTLRDLEAARIPTTKQASKRVKN